MNRAWSQRPCPFHSSAGPRRPTMRRRARASPSARLPWRLSWRSSDRLRPRGSKAWFLPLSLDELLQTIERFVPSLRDVLEIGTRRFHLFRLDLPEELAPAPDIRDEPSRGEHGQVLGNRLSRDGRSSGQPGNRERASGAQPGDQRQPGLVTERRKYRGGAGNLAPAGAMKRHIVRRSPAPPPIPRRSSEGLQHAVRAECHRSLTRPP